MKNIILKATAIVAGILAVIMVSMIDTNSPVITAILSVCLGYIGILVYANFVWEK